MCKTLYYRLYDGILISVEKMMMSRISSYMTPHFIFTIFTYVSTLGQKIHEGGSIKIRPSKLNARPKRNKMCIKTKKKEVRRAL